MGFLCPCRRPGGAGRATAAGHCAATERKARGALEMCGAGPRDPVTGAAGGTFLPPRLWAHCLVLSCPRGSLLGPAVSSSLCSSGNPVLALKMEGPGSEQFWLPEQAAGEALKDPGVKTWLQGLASTAAKYCCDGRAEPCVLGRVDVVSVSAAQLKNLKMFGPLKFDPLGQDPNGSI